MVKFAYIRLVIWNKFGKAVIMLLLTAGAMYGSMNAVLQPKMLRSIVEESKGVFVKSGAADFERGYKGM